MCHGSKIPLKLHCAQKVRLAFETAKNFRLAPLWKALARSYWIDLQITVGEDHCSGYKMFPLGKNP